MSVDNAVSGGKIWSPEDPESTAPIRPIHNTFSTHKAKTGKYSRKEKLVGTSLVIGLILLQVWGLFFMTMPSFDGLMTENAWHSFQSEKVNFLLGILLACIVSFSLYLIFDWFKGGLLPFLLSLAIIAPIFTVWGFAYYDYTEKAPFETWLSETYNYELMDLENSDTILVRDLSLGAIKEVKPYFIDDVTYLAVDEADLNKQLSAVEGK